MTEHRESTILEDLYRKRFDEPTGPVLQQIKFALRIFQRAGYKAADNIPFLLMLESILEKGGQEESVHTKLLRLLQSGGSGDSGIQAEKQQQRHHAERQQQRQVEETEGMSDVYAGMLEEAQRWRKLFDLAKCSQNEEELITLLEQEYPEALKPGGILSQEEGE